MPWGRLVRHHLDIMKTTPRRLLQLNFWIACLILCIAALVPTDQLPSLMTTWWDKAQHALAFATLYALGAWAYPTRRTALAISLLVLGMLIELAQGATGWRQCDLADWVADGVGVAIAISALKACAMLKRSPQTGTEMG